MNGPQHYADAERLLQTFDSDLTNIGLLAEAQVHATLALAAATIAAATSSSAVVWTYCYPSDSVEWAEATA